jgi:hypothetical protein
MNNKIKNKKIFYLDQRKKNRITVVAKRMKRKKTGAKVQLSDRAHA